MNGARPLIIDSFAGGGGASTGIEMALGRSPDIAINHSADALAMHQVNHPDTLHLDSNIWDVSPREVTKGRPVGLLWASPDCKHFSKAKGGKPLDRNIRDLAWVVVRWAEEVRPDVILLENVEEFRTWGPIYEDGSAIPQLRGQTFDDWVKRLKRLGYKVQHRELRACDYGAPTIRKRLFLVARRDGRPIVWPQRTHGDPRKPADAKLIAKGRLEPWRTAAEIIDWSLPCPSIFETSEEIMQKHGVRAVRPLADATMRRIARGVVRYVLEARKPFIVRTDMHEGWRRNGVNSVDEPLRTQTTAGSHAVVIPVITAAQHGGSVRPADAPIHTIAASPKDQNAIIVPSIVGCGGRAGQSAPRGGDHPLGTLTAKADSCVVAPVLVETAHGEISPGGVKRWGLGIKPTDEPMGTGTISGNHALAAITMIQTGYGERKGQAPRALDVEAPIGTQVAGGGKHGVVAAFLAQHNNDSRRIGGVNPGRSADEPLATLTQAGAQQNLVVAHVSRQFGQGTGQGLDEPAATITADVNKSAIVAAHLMNLHGSDRRDQPADTPAPTAMSGGNHAALIAGFLTKYYGEGLPNQAASEPLHTVTALPRHGVVTVEIDGQTFAVADIGMRMLTPRERFRAQGFPDGYIIDRRPDGSPITATVQGSCCGNSVCPPLAEALAAANCGHLAEFREAAE